ncbi:MAG: hypothetical protein Q9162_006997 [Coniocarpon cinnabarinum]
MESQESSQTIDEPSSRSPEASCPTLKLDDLEPILVLPTHLNADELIKMEGSLIDAGAPITYDVHEAKLFLTKIAQKKRILIELRTRGVFTDDRKSVVSNRVYTASVSSTSQQISRKAEKYRPASLLQEHVAVDLTADSSTESESEEFFKVHTKPVVPTKERERTTTVEDTHVEASDAIKVVKLEWLLDSIKGRDRLPFDAYILYEGRRVDKSSRPVGALPLTKGDSNAVSTGFDCHATSIAPTFESNKILQRAQNEQLPPQPSRIPRKRFHGAVESRDVDVAYSSTTQKRRLPGHSGSSEVASLLPQSTTEHDLDLLNDIPESPEWVKRGYKLSCQRSTPVNHPNQKFVDMLKDIRVTRDLIGDEIGIRAYSTAIASISAYPYSLTSPREITALPGCSNRIAALFAEWKNNGERDVEAVREAKSDQRLQTLRTFFEIWGVGAATARDFYNKGWRDLDDVVEYGWNDISRVQQIGVKYYDELQQKIPRAEVEEIRDIVHRHAQRVCGGPDGVRTTIVGGYRRGKAESGDADIMVSHLDDARTIDVVDIIAESLYEERWITHSLGTTHSGSRRGQETLPFKGTGAGSGFDTLDKAMVVWQDPRYEGDDAGGGKNPNVHRRVDIIISPWRTVGCAVLGWSAGTTFERDLRRYAKQTKNWKFDSSGIRDRATGQVVDVETIGGRAASIDEAEKKVFQGLGLEYREPWERCTG